MHNIQELEKRWFNYKIKSFIPHFSFLIISIIVITIFLNIDTNNINLKEEIAEVKKEVPVISEPIEKVKETKIDVVEVEEQTTVADEKMVLTPSFDFIKKLRNDSTNSYKSNDFSSQKKQVKKVKTKPKRVTKVRRKQPERQIKQITIQKQETQADIEHVIKRFKKNNNPALSLFVAKKYYRIGEYEKAYNYALITNELNNEIDESWIVFSKSLVKLGKKDKAIKVLTKYIEHSHSSSAKVLLDNINSGKFR